MEPMDYFASFMFLSYGRVLGLLLLCFLPVTLVAQSGYDLTIVTEDYAELSEGTFAGIQPGQTGTGLDLEGEQLLLYGEQYAPDAQVPLVISGTGFIRLDKPVYSVVIDGFLVHMDSLNPSSGIFHQVDFLDGENVLKIEWRQAALIDTPDVADDYVNFQIWLYQTSGVVELRYGPSRLKDNYGALIAGGPFVGIFRFTQDPSFIVLQKNWLLGDPGDPYHDKVGQSLGLLGGFPAEGTVYRFTPGEISSVENSGQLLTGTSFRIRSNVVDAALLIERTGEEGRGGNARVEVYDMAGHLVTTEPMSGISLEVSVADWPPGTYLCRVGESGECDEFLIVRK